jgi:phospholipase/carboxylesterase
MELHMGGPSPGFDVVGRAWWQIDIARIEMLLERGEARDMSSETPPGIESARDQVMAMLDVVETTMSPRSLLLGGFSQGAMLACDVALRSARKLAGLVMLSGTLLSEGEWRRAMPARKGLKVFMSHGTDDPLLPMSVAERLRDLLAAAQLEVKWMPFRGVHEIPPAVLEKLGEFLGATLR